MKPAKIEEEYRIICPPFNFPFRALQLCRLPRFEANQQSVCCGILRCGADKTTLQLQLRQ